MRPIPSPRAAGPRRVLQLVHGFPPRENAGTEQYAAGLARALHSRGVDVHTFAATRWPGRSMYEVERETDEKSRTTYGTTVTRVVNNLPYGGVRRAERDGVIRAHIEAEIRRFSPDLVHVQHPMFLDIGFVTPVPVVWTLHDAWGWCASGGQLLRLDADTPAACAGPSVACAACASRWVHDGPAATLLLDSAASLAKVVDATRLHRAWQRVPARVRSGLLASRTPVSVKAIERRTAAIRAFAHRCAFLVSPSIYYANLAEKNGFPRPIILPHGVTPAAERHIPHPDNPFVFVGTISPHKGPLLVHQAHRLAAVGRPLELWGPAGPDANYVSSVAATASWHGPTANVARLLSRAHALVLGSVWAENAPLVVLEARALGTPVIAPRIGGLPELVIEGRDGWLYEPGNAADLARCLELAHVGPTPNVSPPPGMSAHVDGLMSHYARVW